MERVGRVARAAALRALPRARLPRGALPDQVLAAARALRRGRARRRSTHGKGERGRGARAARVLDGRRRRRPERRGERASSWSPGSTRGLPPQLELGTLQGRRLAIAHGALDARLPLIPGVKPSMSQAAAERARGPRGRGRARGRSRSAFHAVALRRRDGGLLALPGAARYADFVGDQLERFCA